MNSETHAGARADGDSIRTQPVPGPFDSLKGFNTNG